MLLSQPSAAHPVAPSDVARWATASAVSEFKATSLGSLTYPAFELGLTDTPKPGVSTRKTQSDNVRLVPLSGFVEQDFGQQGAGIAVLSKATDHGKHTVLFAGRRHIATVLPPQLDLHDAYGHVTSQIVSQETCCCHW